MTGYNPNRNPAGAEGGTGGQFASGDSMREEAGQIIDLDDVPTHLAYPEDMKAGDVIIDKDMGMSFTLTAPPERTADGRVKLETTDGTFYGGYAPYPIQSSPEEQRQYEAEYREEVADIINSQIQTGVKMSLGSSRFRATDKGLAFDARMLGYRKDGARGTRVQNNTINVDLNANDYYDITVTDPKGNTVAHTEDVDVSRLNHALLALDYDGDEPFNPRYYPEGNR